MAKTTGGGSFAAIEIKGLKELEATLKRLNAKMATSWSRGAVAEGANVIRDRVAANALRLGLGRHGAALTPSGKRHVRRGRIPGAVHSWVGRQQGAKVSAFVGIRSARRGPLQTFHWKFIEFGSMHNVPTPFFRPGFNQSKAQAMKAMEKVYRYQIARAGRLKKGG